MEHLAFLEALRSGKEIPSPPLFVFVGPERFLMRVAEERLQARLGLSDRRVLWADETGEEGILRELAAPGLFGGAPLYVIKRAEALKSLDFLLDRPGLPPMVLEVHDDLRAARQWLRNRNQRRIKPTQLAASLNKKFKGKLTAVAFPELGQSYGKEGQRQLQMFAGWVKREFQRRGVSPRTEVFRFLLQHLPRDLTAAHQEIEKVALYLQSRPQASVAEVAALLSSRSTFNVFELTGALIQGNIARFLAEFRELQKTGESPQGILALLEHTLTQLVLVKAGVPQDLPKFLQDRYHRLVRSLTLGDLLRLLQRVRDAEIRIRSRSVNTHLRVETLLFELLWWRTSSSLPSSSR